jgi:short-subunit dehydrogenase
VKQGRDVRGAEEELGPIDVLVNNAGIIAVGQAIDEPDAVTKRILAVNAYGPILGSKLAAGRMRRRGVGHVINIASASGLMPVPGIATYSATKHAIVGLTEAIRLENRSRTRGRKRPDPGVVLKSRCHGEGG